ncbi:MAG: choice-of-anchor D domain-containing protein [Nitrospirota bacterium]
MHQSKDRIMQLLKTLLLSGALSYSVVGLNVSALVGLATVADRAAAAESLSSATSSTIPQKSIQPSDPKHGQRSVKGRKLIRRPSARQLVPTTPSTLSSPAPVQGAPTTSPVSPTTSDSSTTGQKEGSTTTSSSGGTTKNAPSGTGSISISTVTSSSVSVPTTSSTSTGSSSNLTSAASASTAAPASNSSSSGNSFAGRALQKLLTQMPSLADILSPQSLSTPASPPPSTTSPTIGKTPASLSFSAVQNGSNPAGQTVTISNTGSETLNWTAVSSANWLSLNGAASASGTNSGSFTVGVNHSGLAVGTYNASITISATGATNTPQTVPVILTVTAAPTPTIGLSTTNLSFTGVQGGANPGNQVITITNTGSGTLAWSAAENAAWLSVSPASGTGNGSITVSVNTAGLSAGTVSAPITITASGATNTPQTVTVSLVVTAPATPAIGYSPASLSFTATQGGANPSNQALSITNTGTGTLSWTVSDNATWLTLSRASGTGNGSVTASVSVSGLAAGTYNAAITIAATGATNTPQTVPVTLTVSAAQTPTIGLSPTSLSFTAAQGAANPAAQTVNVTNPGSGTLTWTASDNASWLTLNTTSGTTTTETDPITVSVNTSGLSAGTYNAVITITASGATNTPQTVPVTLTLNVPATSSATLTWNANTESDLAGYKVYRATAPGAYGAPIATLQGNVTNYVATGLQVGTTYYFVVTAYDSAGNESAYSNEVSKSVF